MYYANLNNWIKDLLKVDIQYMYYGSLIGAGVSLAVGGFDKALLMLTVLIAMDYLTGVLAGCKLKKLDSSVGFKGILKKVVVYIVISFANIMDGAMQLEHLLRSMVIFGYAATEGISIIENVDRMGFGHLIPEFFKNKLNRLREEKLK